MPDSEKVPGLTRIEAYQNSADLNVREGRFVKAIPEDGGVVKYVFQREAIVKGEPKIVETIVAVTPDGKAGIATYGQPAAVRPGPDGAAPPEAVPDPGMSQRYQPAPWSTGAPWAEGLVPPSLVLPPVLGMRPRLDQPGGAPPKRGLASIAPAPNAWSDLIGSIPVWMDGLLDAYPSRLTEMMALARPRTAPVKRPLPNNPFRRNHTRSVDQSLTVTIAKLPTAGMSIFEQERRRVLAYGAHLL